MRNSGCRSPCDQRWVVLSTVCVWLPRRARPPHAHAHARSPVTALASSPFLSRAVIDLAQPALGVNVTFNEMPAFDGDPFSCGFDSQTGQPIPRSLRVQVRCDALAEAPVLASVREVSTCRTEIVMRSKHGCGKAEQSPSPSVTRTPTATHTRHCQPDVEAHFDHCRCRHAPGSSYAYLPDEELANYCGTDERDADGKCPWPPRPRPSCHATVSSRWPTTSSSASVSASSSATASASNSRAPSPSCRPDQEASFDHCRCKHDDADVATENPGGPEYCGVDDRDVDGRCPWPPRPRPTCHPSVSSRSPSRTPAVSSSRRPCRPGVSAAWDHCRCRHGDNDDDGEGAGDAWCDGERQPDGRCPQPRPTCHPSIDVEGAAPSQSPSANSGPSGNSGVFGGEFALLTAVAVGGVALGAAVAMGVIILRRSPARSLAGLRSDAPLAATQSAGDSVEDGDAPSETRVSAGMMQANSLSHQRGAPGGAAASTVAVRVINPLSSPPIANRRKRSAAW